MSFELGTDTFTIIHPDDEYPLSSKNINDMKQYLHGGVNVSGERFSIGFVLRVVNNTTMSMMILWLLIHSILKAIFSMEYWGLILLHSTEIYSIYIIMHYIK